MMSGKTRGLKIGTVPACEGWKSNIRQEMKVTVTPALQALCNNVSKKIKKCDGDIKQET